MKQSVLYKASDLTPDERRAAEILLGYSLDGDELVSVQVSKKRILTEALTGEAREEAFREWFKRIDETAKRVEGVPEEEIDAAIDEAVEYVRHHRE